MISIDGDSGPPKYLSTLMHAAVVFVKTFLLLFRLATVEGLSFYSKIQNLKKHI